MSAVRADFATIDLVRFLIARVDEDERVQRLLVRRTHRAGDHDRERAFARARVDLIAKRQVLGYVQHLLILRDLPRERPVRELATAMLQSMAEPYKQHVLFRSAWDRNNG